MVRSHILATVMAGLMPGHAKPTLGADTNPYRHAWRRRAYTSIQIPSEGAATVVAARKLAREGWIRPEETVVLFNTGCGYKYCEAWHKALEDSARAGEEIRA